MESHIQGGPDKMGNLVWGDSLLLSERENSGDYDMAQP